MERRLKDLSLPDCFCLDPYSKYCYGCPSLNCRPWTIDHRSIDPAGWEAVSFFLIGTSGVNDVTLKAEKSDAKILKEGLALESAFAERTLLISCWRFIFSKYGQYSRLFFCVLEQLCLFDRCWMSCCLRLPPYCGHSSS